jgi:AmmeMemoRadiSam system protein B
VGLFNFLGKPELPRDAKFAGFVYPDNPDELRTTLEDALLDSTRDARAIVTPHSDLSIVAPVAGAAFARLAPAKRVVVIGPSHKIPFAGLAVPNADGWTTPLGTMRIDTAAYEEVADLGLIRVMDPAFDPEPAIEVQLPWLQLTQPKAKLVPLLCGDAKASPVADVLERLLDENTVLVVACEFAWDRSEREVVRLDEETFEAIDARDLDRLRRSHVTAGTPLGALVEVAKRRGWQSERLLHRTSRELGAPDDRTAGYAALVFS